MDSTQFDYLTKQVSRRRVTKGLLASGAAGLFALLGAQQSKAQQSCGERCRGGCADETGSTNRALCMRVCLARCRN
jgi:hypothetical protein